LIFYKVLLDFYHSKLSILNDFTSVNEYKDLLLPTACSFYQDVIPNNKELQRLTKELKISEQEWVKSLQVDDSLRKLFDEMFMGRGCEEFNRRGQYLKWYKREGIAMNNLFN
jgi:hypothetical protein